MFTSPIILRSKSQVSILVSQSEFCVSNSGHPSPFFPCADLNAFNYRPGDKCGDSLQFKLAPERSSTPSHTWRQTPLNRSDTIVTNYKGDDRRESAFANIQIKGQQLLQGARTELRAALTQEPLPNIRQVREYCIVDILSRRE